MALVIIVLTVVFVFIAGLGWMLDDGDSYVQ